MKKKIENNLCKFAPQMYSVLKELQESASYWSEYDVPLGIVDRINDVLGKVENLKKTYRKEYQKQYQKDYAASGKKSEAAKRYYQKHKYEICEKLKNKRKNLQIDK
jgi:hypothetical protein